LAIAKGLDDLCARLNRANELVIALLAAVTVAVTLLQVVFRYVLGSSLSWSEELARYLFIWVIFLGVASAARRGQHMAVEALPRRLPHPMARALALLIALISIVFFAVVVYTGILLTRNAIPQVSSALEVSVALIYVAAPIGALLTILHLVNGAVQLIVRDAAPFKAPTDIS
jgi:TRAP-type transport system small permease protein